MAFIKLSSVKPIINFPNCKSIKFLDKYNLVWKIKLI